MKPILLFVHGAIQNHTFWENQIRFFDNAVAIDLSGHVVGTGKSSIEDYVEEVKEFCDEKCFENIVMVGHSMGGAIVQKFALDYPRYPKAIVLVSTGAKLRVMPVIFETIERNHAEAIELIIQLAFSEKTPNEIKRKAAKDMMQISPDVAYGDFVACAKFDIMDRTKEITVPTLIVCGQEDYLAPVKYSEYLMNSIPNSKLEIIADAGHMVMLEKPEEFNGKLEKFIRRLAEC